MATLTKKHASGLDGLAEAQKAYEGVEASINKNLVKQWRPAEEKAVKERGEALRIFEVQLDKHELVNFRGSLLALMKFLLSSSIPG